jgi:hypothetical protein
MNRFTESEDQFLRDNYLTIPTKRMSKMLGRSESAARQRMQLLGIVVPPEITEKFKKDSQIKPGNVSFNKGKKQSEYMSPEGIEATKATRFKKGNLPHNAAEKDGDISVRRDTKTGIEYLYIRVSLGQWELLQRYNYRQFIGEIPEGYIVALKDGNPKNCDPANLELITQKENMLRNTIHRYPQELISTIRVLAKLKKTIKNYGTEQTH